MLPIQNGLICWLDASDGKAGETLLKDRTSYGHNLVLENFQQGYGFTGKSIKVKKSGGGSTIGNALYIANGGFKTHCKSFCLCIERNNTSEPWYIFDGRGLSGQGSGANHCYNGNTGESYDKSKTRKDGILTQYNAKLETDKKVFFYFELNTAELFTLSILMRYTKNESPEGQFYSLYAYNRALTEQEILHNMEYEKNKISYVNDKNLPKIVEKLSDASNIKITGNKYGNRVQTVIDKIVEKADNVTKAINKEVINNTQSFKIGTGNNVDVSTDVQDSFSEIAMKGQTYYNLYPKLDRSKYASLGSAVKFDGNVIKITANGDYQNFFLKKEALSVKPNTTYTLVIDVLKNTIVADTTSLAFLETLGTSGSKTYFSSSIILNKNAAIGRHKFKVTTRNDFSEVNYATRCFFTRSATSGELWFRYSILEGDHTNNPNLPSYFEGIVGVGDKSKNLLMNSNKTVGEDSLIEFVQFTDIAPIFDKYGLIEYTISFDIKSKDTSNNNTIHVYGQNGSGSRHSFGWSVAVTTEWQRKHITIIPTLTDPSIAATMLAFYGTYNTGNVPVVRNVQIEKGSIATSYEPYYEDYKVEVSSCGKNMLNPQKWIYGSSMVWQKFRVNSNSQLNVLFSEAVNYIECYSCEEGEQNLQYGINGNWKIVKVLNNASKVSFFRKSEKDRYLILCTNQKDFNDVFKNANVSFDSDFIAPKPYTEDKIQLLLDQPLMKLPNGVYDEITKDGKLIRRIGKIVLNGSENWYAAGALDQTKKYFTANNLINNMKQIINSKFDDQISNNLLIDNPYSYPTKSCIWALWQDQVSKIRISVSNIQDVDGIKAWLKQNQTTLYYELQNPIIKDLSNNQIKLFKDGHLTFNTVVAPESSHIVQLNKSAQIQNTIKQSQLLDNKIAVLENNYDSLMLSTMSILNDLEFDYTLK